MTNMRTWLDHAKPLPSLIQTGTNGGASHARPDTATSAATGVTTMVAFISASPRAITEVIVQKGIPQIFFASFRICLSRSRFTGRRFQRLNAPDIFSNIFCFPNTCLVFTPDVINVVIDKCLFLQQMQMS